LFLNIPFHGVAFETLQTNLDNHLRNLEEIRKLENIPVIGLSLVKDAKVIFSIALRLTDIESKQNVDFQSMFRMSSISSSFFGLAALKTQEIDLFNLND
jgi:CubicO group peptidase (beta-lactamase class C family)